MHAFIWLYRYDKVCNVFEGREKILYVHTLFTQTLRLQLRYVSKEEQTNKQP